MRWRDEGARFFGVKGRRYKLWWCGNDDKTGGVGILVKEELRENVVEVRRRCDRVMAIGLVVAEEVVKIICACAPQSGKPDAEKEKFYEEMAHEWSMANANELVLELGDFKGHVGKCAEGFEGIHEGYGIEQGFPNWEPRDFARGAAKACGSYCIYCFSRKKLQRMCVVTVLVVFVLLVTKPLFSH